MSLECVHFSKNSFGAEKNLSRFFYKTLVRVKYLELLECEEHHLVFSILLRDSHNETKEYTFDLDSKELQTLSIDLLVNTSEFYFSVIPNVKNKHFSEVRSKISYNLYFEKFGIKAKSSKFPLNFDDAKKLELV